MYDLTFGQNGHFSKKNQPKEPCVFHAPLIVEIGQNVTSLFMTTCDY
jgi:hypothetical protein